MLYFLREEVFDAQALLAESWSDIMVLDLRTQEFEIRKVCRQSSAKTTSIQTSRNCRRYVIQGILHYAYLRVNPDVAMAQCLCE